MVKISRFIILSIIGVFAFCFLAQIEAAYASQNEQFLFTMHERNYALSKSYQIKSMDGSFGYLNSPKFSIRKSYQYYSQQGQLISTAELRLLSLGSMFTWAGALDIYDSNSNQIGTIEGSVLTLLPSKFCFYDADNSLIATAYMDMDCMGFTIVDPKDESRNIAFLDQIFVRGVTDYWSINVVDQTAIDPIILYSFCAFAIDHQSSFRKDD